MAGQPTVKEPATIEKQAATVKLPSTSTTPAPASATQNAPLPPTESKPDVAAALAPPAPETSALETSLPSAKPGPTITKSGHIQPAVPIMTPQKAKMAVNGNVTAKAPQLIAKPTGHAGVQAPATSYQDANADARAAVAAAMAKLPPTQVQQAKQPNGDTEAINNLTKKVNEMRTDDSIRNIRSAGSGGYGTGYRGGRVGHRGGRQWTESQTKKIDVPKTDYDFATANARFNKQDVLKEAANSDSPAAGTPEPSNSESATGEGLTQETVVIPAAPVYNKTTSFFDNISSESKDREDAATKRLGGREFRSEETKKNLETFGQGSVDSHRGGYRGRGRGRGFRGGRSRGSFRGRGAVATEGWQDRDLASTPARGAESIF